MTPVKGEMGGRTIRSPGQTGEQPPRPGCRDHGRLCSTGFETVSSRQAKTVLAADGRSQQVIRLLAGVARVARAADPSPVLWRTGPMDAEHAPLAFETDESRREFLGSLTAIASTAEPRSTA